MLHIAKMFCLILVATATSISAEDALLPAVENFNAAVRFYTWHIDSKEYLMIQGMMELKEIASVRLDQLAQQRRVSHRGVLEIRLKYDEWDEDVHQSLSKAKTEAVQSFANSKEEVKTYVSMYAEHRISEVQAVMFINENERQLHAIADSAMSKYAAVVEKIKTLIRTWNNIGQLDFHH